MRKIDIDAKQFHNKESMSQYLSELFQFPDYFGGNLDAAFDLLNEVEETTILYFDRDNTKEMLEEEYAYKSLRMLMEACMNNPNLRMKLRKYTFEKQQEALK